MNEDAQPEEVVSARSVRVKLRASPSVVEHFNVSVIEDSPSVAVPAALTKTGLTSVVNHFLNESSLKTSFDGSFEFLDVSREALLKTTLERHLKKFNLTEEDVLVLEYAFPKTSKFVAEGPGVPVPDWISCLCKVSDLVFAGTFDGTVVASKSQSKSGLQALSTTESAHHSQITAATAFELKKSTFLATASKDASIAVRRVMEDGTLSSRIATCTSGEGRSIETVCSALSSDDLDDVLLASGGWGGDIHFFQVPLKGEHSNAAGKKVDGKRRKQEDDGVIVNPSCTLRGHTDNVSSCVWSDKTDPVTLYSGGWDHTLRVWDCIRQVETAVLHAQKPFTSIDYLRSREVVASAHPDHIVRLWDARASGDAVVKLSMKGHRGWVSSVSFEGGDSTLLASASYDRTVRVWDIRGGVPLQTIQTDVTGKLFSVIWGGDNNSQLFLGGSDQVIRTYKAEK